MKKLLLAASIAAFASSAYADEGTFYVRADAGLSMLPKVTTYNVKHKGNNHVVAGLGVGTYLMDNVRAELVLSNHFNAKQSGKSSTVDNKVSAQAMSLTVKGLVDVFDYGMGKVFVGAGVGMTQLSAKISGKQTVAAVAPATQATTKDYSYKAKKQNNVSFLGTVGTTFNVSEGVDLDVAYSYNDHGKTKAFDKTTTKYHFKSHDITAGVRVEL
jgi:opacity protein-like surface antigen